MQLTKELFVILCEEEVHKIFLIKKLKGGDKNGKNTQYYRWI